MEMMGKPNLIWSPIQLRLESQHKIVLIRRLTGVNVNIDGVRNTTHFEVIEIVDDSKPYFHYLDSIGILITRTLLI
jgi:hypothetical protein